jgi:hypothetical protein
MLLSFFLHIWQSKIAIFSPSFSPIFSQIFCSNFFQLKYSKNHSFGPTAGQKWQLTFNCYATEKSEPIAPCKETPVIPIEKVVDK